MSEHRGERLAELIKVELGALLQRGLKDPRIGFVSITNVIVSKDMSHVKVYVSILGDKAKQEETMQGLESAKGFIRSELGKRIRMRYTPELHFIADPSLEEGARILSLINQVQSEGKENKS